MAFKSHAQREKMKEFLDLGRITKDQYEEMAKDTPHDIPHRIPKDDSKVIRRPRWKAPPK